MASVGTWLSINITVATIGTTGNMVVSFNEQQRITTGSKKRCSYQPLTENEESHDQQPRAPQPVDSDRGEHNAGCLTSGLISAFWQNETSRYTSATSKAPHSDSSTALFSSPSSSRELNEMKVATFTATSEARQAITVDTVAPTPTRADWRLSDQNGDSRTTNHSTASASTTRIDVKSPSSLVSFLTIALFATCSSPNALQFSKPLDFREPRSLIGCALCFYSYSISYNHLSVND